MAAVVLTPVAEGTDTDWILDAGASKVIAVDGLDDATAVRTITHNHVQSFTLDDIPGGSIVDNTSIKAFSRGKRIGAGDNYWSYVRYAGNSTLSALHALGVAYGPFTSAALARPGGGNWDATSVNAAEVGVKGSITGNTVYCAQLELQCTYTPASGGFLIIIASILGAIGTGLTMGHMPALISFFNRSQRKAFIFGHEAQQLYTDLVNNPHRRYVWQS